MTDVKIFKLFVQPDRPCLDVLRYLNKNIEEVNTMGAGVRVDKIDKDGVDEDQLEIFRKRGITRLPALMAPDGKVFTGLQQVVGLFEKNLNRDRTNSRLDPSEVGMPAGSAEMGTNPDLTDFWAREMYSGRDKRGRLIPRKDKDEAEDEAGDLERRMAEYNRNQPRHRRPDHREQDIDPTPRHRRQTRREESSEDNIASSEESPPPTNRRRNPPRLAGTGDARGDDMDQRMLAAWMDNNPGEDR